MFISLPVSKELFFWPVKFKKFPFEEKEFSLFVSNLYFEIFCTVCHDYKMADCSQPDIFIVR